MYAKYYVYFNVDLLKLEKFEKKCGAIVKSSSGKTANLKLTRTLVANCLLGILPLQNDISNTFDKIDILAVNILANIIANLFGFVSSINNFVTSISSSVKDGSLGISIIANSISTSAKSYTNNSIFSVRHFVIALIGLSLKIDILNNFFTNVLSPIKALTELPSNITYKKWIKCSFCFAKVFFAETCYCQIFDCCNNEFLDKIYALDYIKNMPLIIYNNHIYLLAFKFI